MRKAAESGRRPAVSALRWWLVLGVVGLLAACSGDSYDSGNNSGGGGKVTDSAGFAATIRPLISSRCATPSCHGSATGQNGLAFGGTNPSYSTIVNETSNHGAFVVAGQPNSSNFYLKIIPVVPDPPGGARMPASGGYLTAAQQELVRRWIAQGALDN